MARPLTERERNVLTFMVDTAVPFVGDPPLQAGARDRWRLLITTAQAGRRCGCGSCPSNELEDEHGRTPTGGRRVVLNASHPKASLLLFIDDDRLSYLELAPLGDDVFEYFPLVSELTV